MAVLHQPHKIKRIIKRLSRLVILPDYQGIGLGVKFLNFMANYYSKLNFDFSIKTSAKNLIFALKKNKNWSLNSYNVSVSGKGSIDKDRKTLRTKTKTASFFYVYK